MRILIITPHFWPESFKINDLAEGLRDRGHELAVLTGLPNYPAGRFYDGYGLLGPYRQRLGGVPIHRVPIIPRGPGRALNLLANYGSFAATGALGAILLGPRRWDVIFVFGPSPVTTIFPAAVVKLLFRTPILTWVQDLWPESVAAAGFGRSKVLYRAIGALSGWLYRRCDRILGTSRAFAPRLERHGVPESRIGYLPQWSEPHAARTDLLPPATQVAWRGGFSVMFAGNLGRVQSLETILDAAEFVRGEADVRWVFLGDGALRGWLASEVARRGLQKQVLLLGQRPTQEMPAYFDAAGAMLVSLKADEAMALTLPAKVQSYMAAGRPIIGSVDGETARVIAEAGCGWSAPAGDSQALARIVLKMKNLPLDERTAMGARGRAYSEQHFSRDRCLELLEAELAALARGPTAP